MSDTLLSVGISNEEDPPGSCLNQARYPTPLMHHCAMNSHRKDKLSHRAGGALNSNMPQSLRQDRAFRLRIRGKSELLTRQEKIMQFLSNPRVYTNHLRYLWKMTIPGTASRGYDLVGLEHSRSLIHLLNKYFLRSYYVPVTVLETGVQQLIS